jgi:ABC-type transporter Mla subunit MlaD
MGTFEALVLALLGVVIGAAVPALLQLRRTLRSAERFLDDTGPRLQRTLETAERAAGRVERIAGDLERDLGRARGLLDAASDLGRSLRLLQGSLRTALSIGAAFGPAAAAAARALFASVRGDGPESAGAPATAPAPGGGNGSADRPAVAAREVAHE